MKLIPRTWQTISTGITLYVLYKQVLAMREASQDLYASLDPEKQLLWDKYFGDPIAKLNLPVNLPDLTVSGTLEKLKAKV